MSDPTEIRKKRRLLMTGAVLLVAVLIGLAPLLGRWLEAPASLLALGAVYWSGCWFLALVAGDRSSLAALYRTRINRRPVELVLTQLPVAATLLVGFLPSVSRVPLPVLAAVLGVSLVNGVTEELFWRGAFVSRFPGSLKLGFLFPLIWFAALHLALALVPGVRYEGGIPALLGGSAFFGVCWGWTAWRTHDLRSVTLAHVLTNTFAFTQLALGNWVA
ncbi:CPBP family intramembrane metalloprotease [Myxococcota bacterium]|nr:CPBP family intramembrane metalloprotease [Myxococcota bacterium]